MTQFAIPAGATAGTFPLIFVNASDVPVPGPLTATVALLDASGILSTLASAALAADGQSVLLSNIVASPTAAAQTLSYSTTLDNGNVLSTSAELDFTGTIVSPPPPPPDLIPVSVGFGTPTFS